MIRITIDGFLGKMVSGLDERFDTGNHVYFFDERNLSLSEQEELANYLIWKVLEWKPHKTTYNKDVIESRKNNG